MINHLHLITYGPLLPHVIYSGAEVGGGAAAALSARHPIRWATYTMLVQCQDYEVNWRRARKGHSEKEIGKSTKVETPYM